eukprot:CAMPEP_0206445824 /NCGR_PEP_ID=MMETSP0324_2-20121206/15756_1 /ASSEMBLY_ACC=CAM_ASM_000836 /TAXON_ID=2866 /ORGANISM="Crypthecodinium cohnii, Strain Seligo" /LENGTH=1097 /DNA_ID=CAMNT_0053914149 /DNA_START=40 /DNA_END=3334 /DNA_ORIENTATION=-
MRKTRFRSGADSFNKLNKPLLEDEKSSDEISSVGAMVGRRQSGIAARRSVVAASKNPFADSSDDEDGPSWARRASAARPQQRRSLFGGGGIMVAENKQEWGGLAGLDSSSEESSEESDDGMMDRRQRYARIARQMEQEGEEDPATAQAFTDEKPDESAKLRMAAVPVCFWAIFNLANLSFQYLAAYHPSWILWVTMFPALLASALVETCLAWTDRDVAKLRFRLQREGYNTVILVAVYAAIVVFLGFGYGIHLFQAYRMLRSADSQRTFLTELESLDPSRQALAGIVRWDAWTLLWGPPILMGLLATLVSAQLSVLEATCLLFVVLILMAGTTFDICNYDFYSSIHIRTHYGTVYDMQLEKWIHHNEGLQAMRNSQMGHYAWRLGELGTRVCTLALLFSSDFPVCISLLLLADFFLGFSTLVKVSGNIAEVWLCSISLFLLDISHFVDEPGLAYIAGSVSDSVWKLRWAEVAVGVVGSLLQLRLRTMLLICVLLLSIGLQYKVAKETKLGARRDDIFTAIARGDAKMALDTLSFDGGCTINLRLCGMPEPTPLLFAVAENQAECVRTLLKRQADVNLVDTNGDTALHLACKAGNVDIVRDLVQGQGTTFRKDVTLDMENDSGKKPKDLVPRDADPILMKILNEEEEAAPAAVKEAPKKIVQKKVHDPNDPFADDTSDQGITAFGDSMLENSENEGKDMNVQVSARPSIFGEMIGGKQFHLVSGPRIQDKKSSSSISKLALATFMFSRAAGEQTERLMEHHTARNREVRLSYLTTIATLGAGGFGRVMKVQDVRTGDMFAMKLQKKDKATKQAIREASEMGRNQHAYIVKLVHIFHTTVYYGILMEFCEKDLNVRIVEHSQGEDIIKGLPVPDSARYISCIVLALEYLHQNFVVFRDLKPENILITSKELGDFAKLTDFGMAKSVADIVVQKQAVEEDETGVEAGETVPSNDGPSPKQAKRMTVKAGTLAFMSGEAMDEDESDDEDHEMDWYAARDWYSLGCCLMLVLLGERGGRKIKHGKREVLLPPPHSDIESRMDDALEEDAVTDDSYELILGLCHKKTSERFNSVQLRNSDLLRDSIKELEYCAAAGDGDYRVQ